MPNRSLFQKHVRAMSSLEMSQSEQKIVNLEEVTGRVHSIETFSAIDGPGIRYLLFLQGCNLRCKSCSNRDTWEHSGGKIMTAKEVVTHMLRYRNYIEGLTISGGEALLQPHFVSAVFQGAHEHGLSTCVDTTGQCPRQYWDLVLPHTDLALVCIKHIDAAKYREFAGVPQKPAMEFVDALACQYGVPFFLRYLYIPDYSDSDADIDKFLDWASHYRGMVRGIELLPYHRLGVEKWKSMGLRYELESIPLPDKRAVQRARRRMEERGFTVLL